MNTRTRILLVIIAYAAFVFVLGLPSGVLGVAWPSIRQSFDVPLDAVGALMIATTTGYMLSSFSSGPIISRIGVGPLLTVSCVVAVVGSLGYAAAPTWWMMVLVGLLAGIGGGAIDAGLNTYFATNHGARLMNWLHASFGLGATFGPIVMTAVLRTGQSWRWGYAIVAILQGVLALCFGLTLSRWRLGGSKSSDERDPDLPAEKVRSLDTLRLPVAWFGIALFFVFTGIEGSGGQWPYSLFTEARAVAPATAGLWVSIYWGSLTAGRIFFGFVADRIGLVTLLRLCMFGVIVGSVLLWWNIADTLSFLGLALIGLCIAPLFPSSISITPKRVGNGHAANAIGFQVASGGLGYAILPALAGVLARNLGLEITGPFLLVAAVGMFLLHEMMVRRTS